VLYRLSYLAAWTKRFPSIYNTAILATLLRASLEPGPVLDGEGENVSTAVPLGGGPALPGEPSSTTLAVRCDVDEADLLVDGVADVYPGTGPSRPTLAHEPLVCPCGGDSCPPGEACARGRKRSLTPFAAA
jgi:hypothetical protein